LRHCAIRWKVACSIPDGVIRIFLLNPSGRTVDLESTQALIEMNTRNIFGGKGGRDVGLTTLPPSCADSLEILLPSTSYSHTGLVRSVMEEFYLACGNANEHCCPKYIIFLLLLLL
jgi:hypothetical protein